ncbi:MAG TPA: SHOCT domain-containing protein [Thermoleophilaceae bacterium]
MDSDAKYWIRLVLGLALMLGAGALLVGCIVKLASIGTCASGGPYVSARPCPAHTEYWIFGIFGAVFMFLAGLWVFSTRGGRGVAPALASSQAVDTPDWASMGGGNKGATFDFGTAVPKLPATPATPSATATATPTRDDRITRLERLQKLREEGALSESEFEVEKAKILSGL